MLEAAARQSHLRRKNDMGREISALERAATELAYVQNFVQTSSLQLQLQQFQPHNMRWP